MNRNQTSQQTIALLATGDEVINGDILNSNAQEIAARATSHGMQVTTHASVGDNTAEIKRAIQWLLQHHRALIITGGLGPTTDDLTRYALAEALDRELIFDDGTWELIEERFTKLGYGIPPENNRQQALFPEGAVVIPNAHGSAAGCIVKNEDHFIFMLPGPPPECLPMVDKVVIPALKIAGFEQKAYHAKWLLFGVSEGSIAEELEKIAKPFQCTTGYRVCYPYVECKIHSENKEDFDKLISLVEAALSPYMIENGKYTASDLLKQKLLTLKTPMTIVDHATGGSLEATLRTPDTNDKLIFTSHIESNNGTTIKISGLDDFWQHKSATQTTLEIIYQQDNVIKPSKFTIPFRGSRVKLYAVEFICLKIQQFLSAI